MKLSIQSTSNIVEVNGVPARVWEGTTENGVDVTCLITRIAVKRDADCSQFERELKEEQPPSAELNAWPLRSEWCYDNHLQTLRSPKAPRIISSV